MPPRHHHEPFDLVPSKSYFFLRLYTFLHAHIGRSQNALGAPLPPQWIVVTWYEVCFGPFG